MENLQEVIDAHMDMKEVLFHHFPGTNVVVCCIVLESGFTVIGTAHAAADFNLDIGKETAFLDAKAKLTEFEIYAAKENQHYFNQVNV